MEVPQKIKLVTQHRKSKFIKTGMSFLCSKNRQNWERKTNSEKSTKVSLLWAICLQ